MTKADRQADSLDRMRVLRISHASLTPALRERERALVRCRPNVELEVVTTRRWREAELDVEAIEDDLFPVRRSRAWLSKHIQLFAYDPRPIVASLRRHRPHLVEINHEPYSIASTEVLTLCNWFAPKAAVVMQVCQNIFRRYPPPFNWLERRALRRVDAASACSETARALLAAKGFKKPVAIVPFGVNTTTFCPRADRERRTEPLTIGFVGRMLRGKGLKVLAEALAMLGSQPWRLMVVGDGPARELFQQELAAHGLIDRTEFVGAVSYDQMPEFYQFMDVVAVPSRTAKRVREQFGRVLVEAMASGVPVIGSTSGAIPEVIADAGLVVPEGDAQALAKALRRMLSDGALRSRLKRAGRERAVENFSWERVAERTYELFSEVLRRRSDTFNETEPASALTEKGARQVLESFGTLKVES